MTEEEIDYNAATDPDNPPWTDEELEAAVRHAREREANRIAVSIRLYPEVVRFFKEQGPGYQSRINRVLLSYVQGRLRRQ
jgi:uncharacterized protein (DUF4415 family)